MFKDKKVLALSPHTDDVDLAAGGSIAKWIEDGCEVFYVAFSKCEESLKENFQKNVLETEARLALSTLGVEEKNIFVLNYRVRHFFQDRQKILENLIRLREEINPDVILLPSKNDIHQDHAVIYQEGLRAFKFKNVLSYEIPWNNFNFNNMFFSMLTKENLEKKLAALKFYESQKHRAYFAEEFIRSLAISRGVMVNGAYAEIFEVVRLVL